MKTEAGPSYPWYPSDALSSSSIQAMTLEEECCYRRLLDYQWLDGKIPTDFQKIRALLKRIPTSRLAKIWLIIGPNFELLPDGSGYVNKRLNFLREERLAFLQNRSDSGKKGMAKRWKSYSSVITEPITKDNSPSPSPSPTENTNTNPPLVPLPAETSKRTARKMRAPAELPITDAMRGWALENQITANLEAETAAMLDHHRGKGNLHSDWVATWRTWMRNTKRFGGKNPNVNGNRKETFAETNRRALAEQLTALGCPVDGSVQPDLPDVRKDSR